MLPETGSISMSQVNVELKKSETAVISLNDTDVRKLAGKPSGIISMNDLRGKKASEYVENYQIYSNSWRDYGTSGSFKITFPKKVISGIISVTSSWKGDVNGVRHVGYIKILGETIQETAKNISVSNIKELNGEYYTGKVTSENDPASPTWEGTVTVNIKFTGEWEA